ncbi:hypothetical protein [Aquibacillus kalidii]|uniref:hypothetical protein n=1 Tax=Aquibacillus kalidii TaxID=2762597 RepID=UPI001C99B59C|nr:hypothetical protein [Aquibacillus kalidii]
MNPAWLFTLASIIAAFGILNSFKKLMAEIQNQLENDELNTNTIQKHQTKYFIRVAITEIIPIGLIIVGFIMKEGTSYSVIDSIIPLIIIIGVLLFSLANVLLIRNDSLASVKEKASDVKGYINNLIFVGLATIVGIPIISLVSVFLNP